MGFAFYREVGSGLPGVRPTEGGPVVGPGDVCLQGDCGGLSAACHTAAGAFICGSGRRQGRLLSCQSCLPSASKHGMGRWCRQSGA